VLLVAFGSSPLPYHRQTAEHHATRLEEQTDYGEVLTAYLLQNPAAECARYTVSNDRIVAVPLFVSACTETERSIPEALELDRGGIQYGEVLGTHTRITDAIVAELAKQRVLAGDSGSGSFEASLANQRYAIATDGEGPPR
jgi:sirohydrochlorin ferrochelatase